MIILQDSVELQQNQEIKISDTISYLNTNSEQPFSDRPVFRPEILPGRDFKDKVTGVPAVCSISGTRYGLVNGVVTQFAINQPPIEDDGLRGCPAFTQYFLNNETPVTQSITLAAGSYCLWVEGSGSATFNGLTATSGVPKVFTLASGFTGNCVIAGTVTKVMLNTDLFPAPFSPTEGVTKSFVSEAATATTGTSFDLDDVKLVRAKNSFRGVGVGPNLWGTPSVIMTPPWTDNGTHYVCDGTNNNANFSRLGAVSTGKLYEITFTTGVITSGTLIIWLGGVQAFNGTPTANTTYTLRTATPSTGVNASFTNSNAFIGQIRKDIVVKEIQAQGHLDVEFKSNINSDNVSPDFFNILTISNNNTGILYLQKEGGTNLLYFKSYDATNIASVNLSSFLIGQIFKISIDWGTHPTGQKIRITVNGVKSTLTNFSGSFGTQDLRFFFGNAIHAGWIVKDSLKVMDRPQW